MKIFVGYLVPLSDFFVWYSLKMSDCLTNFDSTAMKKIYPIRVQLLIFRYGSYPAVSCSTGQRIMRSLSMLNCIELTRGKGRDLTQSYDKSLYTQRKIKKATWQHKNATKNFDYTRIADRHRTKVKTCMLFHHFTTGFLGNNQPHLGKKWDLHRVQMWFKVKMTSWYAFACHFNIPEPTNLKLT